MIAWLKRLLGIDRIEQRLALLEAQMVDKQALIEKLEQRIASNKQEVEAYRNLIAAKAEADSQPKPVVAQNLRHLRRALIGDNEDVA